MKYTVEIIDTRSGETRLVERPTYDLRANGLKFYWSEGNMGCDCNRGPLFYGDDDLKFECTGAIFRVPKLTLEDGTIITIDKAK